MNEAEAKLNSYDYAHNVRNVWRKVVMFLACIVVFCTTYALILPAITMVNDDSVVCGYTAHTHDDACYAVSEYAVWSCVFTLPHGADGYADYYIHTHGRECYDENGALICPLPEVPAHTHGDSCYGESGELICTLSEVVPHIHTEECYTDGVLTCGMVEVREHDHHDCMTVTETRTLVCAIPEHEHDMGCFAESAKPAYICPYAYEHTHTEDCYTDGALICTLTEHTHTEACLPAADMPQNRLLDGTLFAVPDSDGGSMVLPDTESFDFTIAERLTDRFGAIWYRIESDDDTAADFPYCPASSVIPTEAQSAYRTIKCVSNGLTFTFFGFFTDATVARVVPLTDEEESRLSEALLPSMEEDARISSFDISLLEYGEEVTPSVPVKITVSGMKPNDGDRIAVYHVSDGDIAEAIPARMDEDGEVSLTAESFSVYSFALLSAANGDLPAVITTDTAANEWQVVSGRYTGNTDTDSTVVFTTADGNLTAPFRRIIRRHLPRVKTLIISPLFISSAVPAHPTTFP